MRKPPTNEGARELAEALASHGDLKALAEEMGVTASIVSRWANGERRPGVEYRERLQGKLGIHWRSWDSPIEQGAA